MTINRLTSLLLLGSLVIALPLSLHARKDRNDFAEGVQFAESDASPSVAASNINEYTFQDEQINIDPEDGLIKVLRTDQKVLINDYVTAIVRCRNVHPREIRGPIRTMVRKEGGEADVLQDKVSGEMYLHVVCPRFQLPWIEAVVAGLDAPWVKERLDGSGELYYPAKFRNIHDIQRISQFYIGPEGQGRFFFDDLNNAMYYSDQPALIGLQSWGLGQIDIPPNQVTLEVAVYEVDMNNDTMLGLDFAAWKDGPGRNFFEFQYFESRSNTDATDTTTGDLLGLESQAYYQNTSLSLIGVSQYFDFVQNKGYVRELVKTSVTVKSGDPAIVEAVDAVVHFASETDPDIRTSEVVGNPDGDTIEGDMGSDRQRFMRNREASDKVGVRLVLVPFVGLESMELDVSIDVSSVNGYTPGGNPILGVRHISDYTRLVDGEPMVIGGIDREGVVRQKSGAPWLHKLPVAGWLFGNETNAKRNTRIVVLITPQFHLGTESVREMPQQYQTIVSQARGDVEIEIPDNPFGFDQWLLDSNK